MHKKNGKRLVFVAYFTKNGIRYYAKNYGKKAWALWV